MSKLGNQFRAWFGGGGTESGNPAPEPRQPQPSPGFEEQLARDYNECLRNWVRGGKSVEDWTANELAQRGYQVGGCWGSVLLAVRPAGRTQSDVLGLVPLYGHCAYYGPDSWKLVEKYFDADSAGQTSNQDKALLVLHRASRTDELRTIVAKGRLSVREMA